MTPNELIAAHVNLTPILASLAIAWHLKECELLGELGPMGPHHPKRAAHQEAITGLRARIACAKEGVLEITRAEQVKPDSVPFLIGEIVQMAEVTGRLKLID